MALTSDVARIQDAIAARAAVVCGDPAVIPTSAGVVAPSGTKTGITAIYGCGTDSIGDPLRPGQKVQAAPALVVAPGTLAVGTPYGPAVFETQQTVLYVWQYDCSLYFDSNLGDTAFSLATRFIAALVPAYLSDRTLSGLCDLVWISSFGRLAGPEDATWLKLPYTVSVQERIDLP